MSVCVVGRACNGSREAEQRRLKLGEWSSRIGRAPLPDEAGLARESLRTSKEGGQRGTERTGREDGRRRSRDVYSARQRAACRLERSVD